MYGDGVGGFWLWAAGRTAASSCGQSRSAADAHTRAGNLSTSAAAERAAARSVLCNFAIMIVRKSKSSLEKLDLAIHVGANPQFGRKSCAKLRAGVMPPPECRRPDHAAYNG